MNKNSGILEGGKQRVLLQGGDAGKSQERYRGKKAYPCIDEKKSGTGEEHCWN